MKQPPKILVLATSRFSHGGISTVLKSHEKTSVWHDFNCRWIATHKSGSKLTKILYLIKGMAEYVLRLPGADIVHVHTSLRPSPNRKLLFLRLAKMTGKKTVVHYHFDCDSIAADRALYEKVFKIADVIVVLSKCFREQLIALFPEFEDKIRVVYNPCSPVITAPIKKQVPYILFIGVLNKRKGYSDLIKAFATVSDRFEGWKLVIAGDGELAEAKRLAEDCNVADKVEFPGWVAGHDKDTIFRGASIFCLASYFEGFPMSVLEAWAYGLPVVTTPAGALMEIIVDGKNALTFEPGNVQQLSHQLSRLMGEEELRERMAWESLSLARNEFDLETAGEELRTIYTELLDK